MEFDVVIIGWGKGGKTIAGKLAAAGKKVALVERSATMYGGTCINIACVPTKTLIEKAKARSDADPARYFAKSVAERDEFIDKLRNANYGMLASKVTLIDGTAQFTAPHTVRVKPSDQGTLAHTDIAGNTDTIEHLDLHAQTIVINTGTQPRQLNIPGSELARVYDSTTIQHADPFPQQLAIIGGSFIALEFATMFAEFGAHVTILNRSAELLPQLDPDMATVLSETLQQQGITIINAANASAIDEENGALRVHYTLDDDEAAAHAITCDGVLGAIGRVPAVADLALGAAGIAQDERGYVVVDDQLRTNVAGVYAVGDVHGGPQFTYLSYDDSRILESVLLGDGSRTRSDRVAVPWTMFTNPPFAAVGLTEREAHEQGLSVRIASKKIAEIPVMPRPKILGNPAGIAKFVIDADTDQILGAAIYSVDSQELINMVALAIRAGVTATELRDGIWTHPSSTELFNGVL